MMLILMLPIIIAHDYLIMLGSDLPKSEALLQGLCIHPEQLQGERGLGHDGELLQPHRDGTKQMDLEGPRSYCGNPAQLGVVVQAGVPSAVRVKLHIPQVKDTRDHSKQVLEHEDPKRMRNILTSKRFQKEPSGSARES